MRVSITREAPLSPTRVRELAKISIRRLPLDGDPAAAPRWSPLLHDHAAQALVLASHPLRRGR